MRYRLIGAALVAVFVLAALPGCSAHRDESDTAASVEATATTTPAANSNAPSVADQIAIITGRDDVALTPIEDAQVWLGDDDYQAYVDLQTHDEFIVDEARALLLSYAPGSTVYQEPIDLAQYPGEPTREEVMELAREWAVEHLPDRDISAMRPTALRSLLTTAPKGDVIFYCVAYQRYVNGVRMPELAVVSITLPTWDWTPSCIGFDDCEEYVAQPAPLVTMLEAVEIAAAAADYSDYEVDDIDLYYRRDDYVWSMQLTSLSPHQPEGSYDHTKWLSVDALTGECFDWADVAQGRLSVEPALPAESPPE